MKNKKVKEDEIESAKVGEKKKEGGGEGRENKKKREKIINAKLKTRTPCSSSRKKEVAKMHDSNHIKKCHFQTLYVVSRMCCLNTTAV
jgi:hypothetical protein